MSEDNNNHAYILARAIQDLFSSPAMVLDSMLSLTGHTTKLAIIVEIHAPGGKAISRMLIGSEFDQARDMLERMGRDMQRGGGAKYDDMKVAVQKMPEAESDKEGSPK